MSNDYEYLSEDILRNIASYSQVPRLRRVSRVLSEVELTLEDERRDYMDSRYPRWDLPDNDDAIRSMILAGDIDAVLYLLSHGGDVNRVLHYTIEYDKVDILQVLFNGMIYQEISSKYRELLLKAIDFHSENIIKFLRNYDPLLALKSTNFILKTLVGQTNAKYRARIINHSLETIEYIVELDLPYNKNEILEFIKSLSYDIPLPLEDLKKILM